MRMGTLDPASNRATFQTIRQIVDTETGEAADLSGATITFEIRERGCLGAVLSATNGDGIGLADAYTYQVTFSETAMRGLKEGTYEVGLTIERDGITTQVIIGLLPVHDGVVN
jgi:hypothetical protein